MDLQFLNRHKSLIVIGFFVLYFLLGLSIFRHYGISWDEQISRSNGLFSYQYITGQSSDLLRYKDKDYGVAFELPLVVIEEKLGIKTPQEVFYLRHFLTFLFFFVASIFFYKLASKRFGAWLGLLAVTILILTPRIFADSFYNSKDIGLLSAMIISIFTLFHFLEKPNLKRALIHGVACAFVVDIRLPGLIIVPITLGAFALDTLLLSQKSAWLTRLKTLSIYLVSFLFFTVLFWPYLWSSPIGHFGQAFSNFSRFLRFDDTVLYFGNYFRASVIPWHYPLVWIAISTPLIYIAFFLAGIVFTALKFFKNISGFYKSSRYDLVFLAWFFAPLFMVIAFNSSLYDGWRQLYFIYPALILIAIVGFEGMLNLVKHQKAKFLFLGILAISVVNLVSVLNFMIFYHPYQNLYFNRLVGGMENAKQNFELDYWGLTFREGLEYIAKHDSSPQIPVFFAHGNKSNIDILKEEDRKRFIALSEPKGAKYILSNYRWLKDLDNYRWKPEDAEFKPEEFYSVIVDGTKVMTVFKLY